MKNSMIRVWIYSLLNYWYAVLWQTVTSIKLRLASLPITWQTIWVAHYMFIQFNISRRNEKQRLHRPFTGDDLRSTLADGFRFGKRPKESGPPPISRTCRPRTDPQLVPLSFVSLPFRAVFFTPWSLWPLPGLQCHRPPGGPPAGSDLAPPPFFRRRQRHRPLLCNL